MCTYPRRAALGDRVLPSLVQAWNAAGARLSIGIQSDRFRPAVDKLTAGWERRPHVFACDVTSDAQLDAAFAGIADVHGGRVHCLLHSVAYASAAAMKAPLLECSRADFTQAHDISAYSLVALARRAAPLMSPPTAAGSSAGGDADDRVVTSDASLLTLSYLGSQRVVPQYRVMGAAKASLEATARQLAVELVSSARATRKVAPAAAGRVHCRRPPLLWRAVLWRLSPRVAAARCGHSPCAGPARHPRQHAVAGAHRHAGGAGHPGLHGHA
jgi:enoyl-[acyl-carrier-protein] reductase (NADH)